MASRLMKLRGENKTLASKMRYFCLDPRRELFDSICANGFLRRKDEFECWYLAALYINSDLWGLEKDPQSGDEIAVSHEKFLKYERDLCDILNVPGKAKAMKILYIFFATGQFKYIDIFYQTMGHERLCIGTRRELMGAFNDAKDTFVGAISTMSREQFEKLNIPRNHVDFSSFEKYKENLDIHKEDREQKLQILKSIIEGKH